MKSFYKVWWIALAVKTALAIWLPFLSDESYYWVWGHHPQLSYFDHPPMAGWLFLIGTFFESFGNAARLPGVWLGHLTLLVWQQILAPYMDENKQRFWLAFVLLSPFLGIGSLIITPDVPLLFFWSLSLLILLRLVEEGDLQWYLALGAALGLGFLSKYLIVIFVPTAFIWLAWSGKWRKLRWQYIPLTVLVGLVVCTPVLLWNWRHEWASFAFQLNHGLASEKWSPKWPLDYIGGQLALLFPTVVWLACMRRENKEARFLHFFAWVPLAFFLYTSFKARVEANWPIMAYPAVFSLAVLNMRNTRWLKATAGLWLIVTLLALSIVAYPWLPTENKKIKTSEFTKFDAFVPEAEKEAEFYVDSYQGAAAVSYRLRHQGRQIYKLGGSNRRDFYDFMPQSYPKGDRFVLGSESGHPLPSWLTERGYQVVSTRWLSNGFRILEVSRRAQSTDR